jgi:hypothetical protein
VSGEATMINWSHLTESKKEVKASDQKPCGNVIAEYKDRLIIIEGGSIKSHEYIVPKSTVDHYDGKIIYLNISRDTLLEFDV